MVPIRHFEHGDWQTWIPTEKPQGLYPFIIRAMKWRSVRLFFRSKGGRAMGLKRSVWSLKKRKTTAVKLLWHI